MAIEVYHGECVSILTEMEENKFDSCVTDPPYGLNFMGKQWDTGAVAFDPETWKKVYRVLKPGAHLLAFGGTRTFHRMACAIEDAGFEIRDTVMWVYGTGFPKSHNISKAIDKVSGVEFESKPASGVGFMGAEGPGGYNPTKNQLTRVGESSEASKQWEGWGTALKPAWEPIILARKPLIGTVVENVLEHGVGGLNIDGCRVETSDNLNGGAYSGGEKNPEDASSFFTGTKAGTYVVPTGRFPANLIHDGSEEVINAFPTAPGQQGKVKGTEPSAAHANTYSPRNRVESEAPRNDSGSAARFFYSAKATKTDRNGSKHPTVKPISLMQYLCRLVTPPKGVVLDPFAGSGTTGQAAVLEGFSATLIEREDDFYADIIRRFEGGHHVSENSGYFQKNSVS